MDANGSSGISLRKAAMPDLRVLYEWRNHHTTRDASHNTHEITQTEHEKWLQTSLLDPNREIYIAEQNGCPVGTVRVDRCEELCELSWTIAPECRGRGVGKWIVREVADKIKGRVRAEIKVGNTASIRIAEYAGLKLEYEKDGFLVYSRPCLE